jgi:single-strand DNA-binding protein
MSVNKAMLVGRLGADPELRYVAADADPIKGRASARLRLATNRTITGNDGQRRELTDWHDVVVWGKQAEAVAEHTRKGALLFVEGRLHTRSWEQDGHRHERQEVVAEQVQFLSRAPERQAERQPDREVGR